MAYRGLSTVAVVVLGLIGIGLILLLGIPLVMTLSQGYPRPHLPIVAPAGPPPARP